MKSATFLLTLTMVFITCNIYSQTVQTNPDKKEIIIALKMTPSLTWDSFGSYVTSDYHILSPRLVINGGIESAFEITKKKWYIETGILLSDFGFKEKRSNSLDPNSYIMNIVEKNRYVSLPLSIIHKFKIIYIGAGFTFNQFLDRRRVVNGEVFRYNEPIYYAYRSNGYLDYWLLGVQAKTGLTLKLKPRWTLKTEVQFSSAGLGGVGFYNFGLGISVDYKIR